jgi:chromosome segregation ATPase
LQARSSSTEIASELLNRLDVESKRRIAAELELEEQRVTVRNLTNRMKPLEDEIAVLKSKTQIAESDRVAIDTKRILENADWADHGFDRMKRILSEEREKRDRAEREVQRLQDEMRRERDIREKDQNNKHLVQSTLDRLRERLEHESIASIEAQGEVRRLNGEIERLKSDLVDATEALKREQSKTGRSFDESRKGFSGEVTKELEDEISRLRKNLEDERAKRLQASSEAVTLQHQHSDAVQEIADMNVALQRATADLKREKEQRLKFEEMAREFEEKAIVAETEVRRVKDEEQSRSRSGSQLNVRISELEQSVQQYSEVRKKIFFRNIIFCFAHF